MNPMQPLNPFGSRMRLGDVGGRYGTWYENSVPLNMPPMVGDKPKTLIEEATEKVKQRSEPTPQAQGGPQAPFQVWHKIENKPGLSEGDRSPIDRPYWKPLNGEPVRELPHNTGPLTEVLYNGRSVYTNDLDQFRAWSQNPNSGSPLAQAQQAVAQGAAQGPSSGQSFQYSPTMLPANAPQVKDTKPWGYMPGMPGNSAVGMPGFGSDPTIGFNFSSTTK